MDYKTLKSIGEEYFKDRTPTGVTKSNMFNEYLGNTGMYEFFRENEKYTKLFQKIFSYRYHCFCTCHQRFHFEEKIPRKLKIDMILPEFERFYSFFFQNDRDAARVLTAVAFHIRRPNKQLVREFEQLMNWQGTIILKNSLYFYKNKSNFIF